MKRNNGIDALKLICAFLVILIHVPTPYRYIILPLTRCAVPCFLVISGYFIFNCDPILFENRLKKGIYRILKINSLLLLDKELSFIYLRNFAFVGIPYFCIGMWLKMHQSITNIVSKKRFVLLTFVCLFAFTSLLERYILSHHGINAVRDHYISSTLLSVGLFLLCLNISRVPAWASKIGRDYSLYIYTPPFIPVFI